jgi:hypothetical protein
MYHYLVKMKEFVIVNTDLEDPFVQNVCYDSICKDKGYNQKDIGPVLNDAVQTEFVFINLVLMVQCVKLVKLIALY